MAKAKFERTKPHVNIGHVFLTLRVPVRPLDHSVPSDTAARAARRAGVVVPRAGSHVLRHSAATAVP